VLGYPSPRIGPGGHQPRYPFRTLYGSSVGKEILDTDLARVSPLCRAHIIPTGTYSFQPEIPGVDIAHNTLP